MEFFVTNQIYKDIIDGKIKKDENWKEPTDGLFNSYDTAQKLIRLIENPDWSPDNYKKLFSLSYTEFLNLISLENNG